MNVIKKKIGLILTAALCALLCAFAVLFIGPSNSAEAATTNAASVKVGETTTEYADFAEAWTAATDVTTTADSPATVTLLNNIELSADLTVASGNYITLDLNGYVLKGTGSASVITVQGSLTLKDSQPSAVHKYTVGEDGLWTWDDTNGAEILTGGAITGGSAENGGGIVVNGSLTMQGGYIVGNKSTGTANTTGGGGVSVSYGGTFSMTGGEIVGNTATRGGVYVAEGGTFNMSGSAEISNNTASNSGGGVYVRSGTFNMSGTAKISNNTASSYGGGVYVNSTFNMNGGTISNNTASNNGGGVFVSSTGSFTMNGGEISNNTASNNGGGVYVNGTSTAAGTFTMNGGTISNNTATTFAGGVDVFFGTFTMNDGTISNNTATNGGGGVGVAGGTFTMSGGTISKNTATQYGGGVHILTGSNSGTYKAGTFIMTGGEISSNTASSYGGGVYCSYYNDSNTGTIYSCTFNLSGGKISGNTATTYGGGVYVDGGGTFNLSGAPQISGNTLTDADSTACNVYLYSGKTITVTGALSNSEKIGVTLADGTGAFTTGYSTYNTVLPNFYFTADSAGNYAVITSDGEASLATTAEDKVAATTIDGTTTYYTSFASAWTAATGAATTEDSPATVTLLNNIELSADLTVASGNYITLDLNGYVLKGTGTSSVITVQGSLTLKDSQPTAVHKYTVGEDGLWVWNDDPTATDYKTLTGGAITGGTGTVRGSYTYGGGVYVFYGTLTMNGGNIVGNTASYAGGGVHADSGTFTMNGGEISGNTAKYGGGVHADSGTFTMNGGEISGNTAKYGGGVYVSGTSAQFTMSGGEIVGNTASSFGGGVYVDGGTFTMNGGEISGNTASYGGGVYVNGTSAQFTMSGGNIVGNTASSNGGVYVSGGTFTMTGGEISGNTAAYGSGVYCDSYFDVITMIIYSGTFNLSGGTISGNTASTNGGGVYVTSEAIFNLSGAPQIFSNTLTDGTTANNVYLVSGKTITITGALSEGANVGVTLYSGTGTFATDFSTNNPGVSPTAYFTSDNSSAYVYLTAAGEGAVATDKVASVTVGEEITDYPTIDDAWAYATSVATTSAESPATVTLLNNIELSADLTVASGNYITLDLNGYVLKGTGSASVITVEGNITLKDSQPSAVHKYTKDETTGLWSWDDTNGAEILTGGAITGGSADVGGGVCIDSGTFNLSGGAIVGNTSTNGGGVYVYSGTFTMSGGAIVGNTSTNGGVYVEGGTFTMDGGNIVGNNANEYGGGVFVSYGGTFNLSGAPQISGNTLLDGTTASNVYLLRGKTITITGALSNSEKIGVTLATGTGTFTTDYSMYHSAEPSTYFVADDGNMITKYNGEAVVSLIVTVSGITAKDKIYDGDDTAELDTTAATLTGTVKGETVAWSDTLTLSASGKFSDKNAGEDKEVTLSLALDGANAYLYYLDLEHSQSSDTATISPKNIGVTITPNGGIYGGTITEAEATLNDDLVSGETLAITLTYTGTANDGTGYNTTTAPEKAGTYTVTATIADGNYALTGMTTADFTVEKASLTITAKNKTITYGDAPANDGVSYGAFVNGESEEVLNGTLSFSYDYKQFGDVGTYTITPGGLTANNYEITFTTGTLTVEEREIGLSWTNTALTYNGTEQQPTATATGLVNDDECEVTVNGGATNVGNYTATAASLSNANYKLPAENTSAYTIGKATVNEPTISSKVYTGETLTAEVAESTLYTVTENDGGESVGDYDVVLTLADAANYKWSTTDEATVTLTFTITNIANEWTSAPSVTGWTYGDAAIAPTAEAKFGTVKIEYRLASGSDEDYTENVPVNAGEYFVRFSVAATTDYGSLTEVENLTISPKDITVTIAADLDHLATATVIGAVDGETVEVTLTFDGDTEIPTAEGDYAVVASIDNENYRLTGTTTATASRKKAITPAGCEDDGEIVYTAEVVFDGSTSTDSRSEPISATGHSYGAPVWSWTDYTSATATFTCSVCGDEQTVSATITDSVTTPATCTATGVRTYTATVTFDGTDYTDTNTETIPATGHSYGEPVWSWTDYTSATATFTCSVCGDEQTVTATITDSVTTPATCTATGVRTYTATVNFDGTDYTDTNTETIPATGHSLTRVAALAPTCDRDGNVEYWHCSLCGKNFTDFTGTTEIEDVTIPATGHNYGELIAEVPATEDERGIKAHYVCSECGQYFDAEKNEVEYTDLLVAPTGHDLGELIAEVPATCTTNGVKAHYVCADCGKYYDEYFVEVTYDELIIPALGHDFGDWSHDESEHWRVCSRDGYEERAPHSYGEWEIVVQPTEQSTGLKRRVCAVCGEVEEQEIAKLVSSSEGVGNVIDLEPEKEYELNVTATELSYDLEGESVGYLVELWVIENGERTVLYDDTKDVLLTLAVPSGMENFTLYRKVDDRLDAIDASAYTVTDGIVTIRTTLTAEFVFNSRDTVPAEKAGLEWWGWMLIGIAAVGVVAAIVTVVMIRRKKIAHAPEPQGTTASTAGQENAELLNRLEETERELREIKKREEEGGFNDTIDDDK